MKKIKKIDYYLIATFLKSIFLGGVFLIFLLFFLNFLVSNLEEKFFKRIWQGNINLNSKSEVQELNDYLFNLFYATFSGFGWLNSENTDMYLVHSMSAFIYPPKLFIKKIEDENLINFLVLKEENLKEIKKENKNKEEMSFLPIQLKNKNIVERVVKKFGDYSIIVFKEFGNNLYYFWLGVDDGSNFKLLKDSYIFESKYDGTINIGGDLNNFLILLNAYEGRGVQVKNLSAFKDISYLFEIRLMGGGGYEFNIVKKDFGNNQNYWYLWFYDNNFLKVVKLFENQDGWIVGGFELTKFFGDFFKKMPDDFNIISNSILKEKDEIKIYFRYNKNYYEFIDNGFEKKSEFVITSLNINNYPFPVKKVKFSFLDNNFLNDDKFTLEISDNNLLWQKIDLDKEIKIDFLNNSFYWRFKIYPSLNNNFNSVFLKGFKIELFLDKSKM